MWKKSSTNFKFDLSRILDKIVSDICQQYSFECNKVRGSLEGFCKKYESDLIEIMKGNLKYTLFRDRVVEIFNETSNNLDVVFDNQLDKRNCPKNLGSTLFSEYRKLQKVEGLHGADIHILLDSHYIGFQVRVSKIGFITFDKGIIKGKSEIEKILSINIMKPN